MLFSISASSAFSASTNPVTGFREHVVPANLHFTNPTPAFDPANPDRELGQFQPGIRVSVQGIDREHPDFWRVRFDAPGSPAVDALISIPPSAGLGQPNWSEVEELIEAFPLLHRLLKHPNPWAEEHRANPGSLLSTQVAHSAGDRPPHSRLLCGQRSQNQVWGMTPVHLVYDLGNPQRPKYVVEIWSKGEAFRRRNFQGEPERNALRRQLEQITQHFDRSGNSIQRARGSNPHIRGLRDNIEYYYLPNDLRVALHFHHREYLFLEIEQASVAKHSGTVVRSPTELAEHLRSKVNNRSDGIRYIGGIPMVDQGQTGYCVPATMARVLNFYGYDVHTHSLAMLAATREQEDAFSGGTTVNDMMAAMRRITDGSPFRLREISDHRPDLIRGAITSGLPIVWLIPGHMRLIIGISEDGRTIVYSDTWGAGHDFKTMSFQQFQEINQGMWILEPR